MLDKTQSKIDELQKLIEQLENIMQWALYEGDDVSGYVNTITKIETKIWRLETGIVN